MIQLTALDTTRIFSARYTITLDGAVLSAHDHLIVVTGYGEGLTFEIDGRPATLVEAEQLRRLALSRGTFERLSGPALAAPLPEPATIGRQVAAVLHRDLARLGITRHYQAAQEALGYPVSTLATLTRDEAIQVWSYACSQFSLPTLPSIVFGTAA